MAKKVKASAGKKKNAPAKKALKKAAAKKPAPKKVAAKKPAKAVAKKPIKAAAKKPIKAAAKKPEKKVLSPKVGATGPDSLKFYRHPSSGAYYGAYSGNHVHVKRGNLWGEFDRNGNYIEGGIRYADPCFCRWVTGEHIYNQRITAAKTDVWPLTRLLTEGR